MVVKFETPVKTDYVGAPATVVVDPASSGDKNKPKVDGDKYGTGGPSAFTHSDPVLLAKQVNATLTSTNSLLGRAEAGISKLEDGANLEGNQLEKANAALNQLNKVVADLSANGLGAAAADAEKSGELGQTVERLGAAFVALEAKINTATAGNPTKGKLMFAELVRGQLDAADLALKMGAKVDPKLESSGVTGSITGTLADGPEQFKRTGWAHYNKGKNATHFGKVLHFGLAEADLERVRGKANDDPATLALVENRLGLIRHQWGADDEALKLYDKARKHLDGKYPPADYNSAVSALKLGDRKGSLEYLSAAIANASGPEQALQLRNIAAKDKELLPLLSEPKYQAIVEAAGGPQHTKIAGDLDHRGRQMHQSFPWSYNLPVVEVKEVLDEEVARMNEELRKNNSSLSLLWNGDKAELIAERAPIIGAISEVVLANLEMGAGSCAITMHAADRLIFDPNELHKLFGDLKLRDKMI